MANVVITGGAGFLGSRIARELLAAGWLDVAGGGPRQLTHLTLIDSAPVPPDLAADERVTAIRGDLGWLLDPASAVPAALTRAEVVFHLAAAVSAACEADFDLGVRANLRATESLLEFCRRLGTNPVVVFASSVAVFGASDEHPLPEIVDDHTMPNPQSSYGVQKVIGELLLADYTRKGFLRGRAVRLMTVAVRPAGPTQRLRASSPASCESLWPASARSARSTRGPKWPSPRRPGPWKGCCELRARPSPPGAAAPRSTCRPSP